MRKPRRIKPDRDLSRTAQAKRATKERRQARRLKNLNR